MSATETTIKPVVLVVDDNPTQQMLMSLIVARCGMDVVVADNGVQALEEMQKHGLDYFRLILMDWRMPELDGLECTKKVRELEKLTKGHVPIIGLTASAMDGDRKRCEEAGMDDYMTKPFSIQNLKDVMKMWVQRANEPNLSNVYTIESTTKTTLPA